MTDFEHPEKNMGFLQAFEHIFYVFFQWILFKDWTSTGPPGRLPIEDQKAELLRLYEASAWNSSGLQVQEAGFLLDEKTSWKQRIPRVHKGGCFQTKKPATFPGKERCGFQDGLSEEWTLLVSTK